jgi:hypothetical protein
MAGKKSNTIQRLTKHRSVGLSKLVFAKKLIVLTITAIKKSDFLHKLVVLIKYFREIEARFKVSVSNTKEVICSHFSVTSTEVKLHQDTLP